MKTMSIARVPRFIEPMQCLPVQSLPAGEGWEYELKLDGYGSIAVKHAGHVELFSRNRKSFNHRYPALVNALAQLPDETVIDGEIVALDASGRPSFNRLQNASSTTPLTLCVFDLLMLPAVRGRVF